MSDCSFEMPVICLGKRMSLGSAISMARCTRSAPYLLLRPQSIPDLPWVVDFKTQQEFNTLVQSPVSWQDMNQVVTVETGTTRSLYDISREGRKLKAA